MMPSNVWPAATRRGIAEHERHPERLFEHEPLVEPSVLTEEEALIGRVHHHRVVEVPAPAEPVGEAADVLVDGVHAREVVAHVHLVLPRRLLVVRQALGWVLPLQVLGVHVVGDPHRRPTDRRAPGRVVVVERLGEGSRFGEQLAVLGLRLPRTVRRLVPDQHAPRIVALERLDPVDREVGDDVGGVPLDGAPTLGRDERRVPVVPLAGHDVPVVEPFRVVALAVAHVPLADHRGAVAGVAQLRDERRLARIDRREQGVDAVHVAVGAGEDRRARRGAQRVRDEAVVEAPPVGGELVDARCLVDDRAVAADRVGGVVVGQDEDDVGSAVHGVDVGRLRARRRTSETSQGRRNPRALEPAASRVESAPCSGSFSSCWCSGSSSD